MFERDDDMRSSVDGSLIDVHFRKSRWTAREDHCSAVDELIRIQESDLYTR
jgi:hypothetical protein